MAAAGALWLIPIVVVAFAIRTVLVLTLRKKRPALAASVDRWWAWAPAAVVLVIYGALAVALIVTTPVVGIALTILGGALLYFGLFSASSTGSPFRPRRR